MSFSNYLSDRCDNVNSENLSPHAYRMSYFSNDASSDRKSSQPPPIPRRPNLSGLFNQQYSSPYSGLGSSMSGNPYQSLMHGNPGFGYNGYGMRGSMVGNNSLLNGVEDVTQSAFDSVGSVVQAFSSVSMMLESTLFALQNSVRAIVSVADQFSHLRLHLITSGISMLRTIQYYFNKLMVLFRVRNRQTDENIWKEVMNGVSRPADTKHWTIVLFFAVVIGTPWLIWKLLRNILSVKGVNNEWYEGIGEHFLAEVKFSFSAENKDELSINCGDVIRVAPKNRQPRVRGWVLASDGENHGIVPANYINILGKNRSEEPKEEIELKKMKEEKLNSTIQDAVSDSVVEIIDEEKEFSKS